MTYQAKQSTEKEINDESVLSIISYIVLCSKTKKKTRKH